MYCGCSYKDTNRTGKKARKKLPKQMSVAAWVLPWTSPHVILEELGTHESLESCKGSRQGRAKPENVTKKGYWISDGGGVRKSNGRQRRVSRARQGKASDGSARKAAQVLEGEGKAMSNLDNWVRKSGGGWVSKSMEDNGKKPVCVSVCWGCAE